MKLKKIRNSKETGGIVLGTIACVCYWNCMTSNKNGWKDIGSTNEVISEADKSAPYTYVGVGKFSNGGKANPGSGAGRN